MSPEMLPLLLKSFWETGYMVLASTILATVIGIPLGVILTVTRRDHILPNTAVNGILGAIVNATRSTPFIILMVAIIPFTTGSSTFAGVNEAAICALKTLTINWFPSRDVENDASRSKFNVTLVTPGLSFTGACVIPITVAIDVFGASLF